MWTGKYIVSQDTLNGFLALHLGDIFDISKVRETLDQLRDFYKQRGYIKLSAVPDTEVDEALKTVSLTIDVDAGTKFRLAEIQVSGYPYETRPDPITKALMASGVVLGMAYNGKALEKFFEQHADLLARGASVDRNVELTTDDQKGWVILRIFWQRTSVSGAYR